MVEILKLMLNQNSVIRTQPSGPLCLWQCFLYKIVNKFLLSIHLRLSWVSEKCNKVSKITGTFFLHSKCHDTRSNQNLAPNGPTMAKFQQEIFSLKMVCQELRFRVQNYPKKRNQYFFCFFLKKEQHETVNAILVSL